MLKGKNKSGPSGSVSTSTTTQTQPLITPSSSATSTLQKSPQKNRSKSPQKNAKEKKDTLNISKSSQTPNSSLAPKESQFSPTQLSASPRGGRRREVVIVTKAQNPLLPRAQPMMVNNSTNGKNSGHSEAAAGLNNGNYKKMQRVTIAPGTGGIIRRRKYGRRYTDSYKVIAFLCGLFACILLVMALASSEWLLTSGYRQGLFVYCVTETENGTVPRVPFLSPNEQGSDRSLIGYHRIDLSKQAYTLIAAGFCVVSLLVNIFATLLTILGLRCKDPNNKYRYYRIAVYVMLVALVTILVALIIYPVCFSQIMSESERDYWEFGWAYGVGWGASIFLFGGIILLLCDKESEEIYYKERTIVQYADTTTNK